MPQLNSRRSNRRYCLSLAAILLIGTSLATAQDQKTAATNAPVPPKNPWETTAAAGLTLTRGNSETLLATFSLDTKRKWGRNEAAFGAAAGYGEDKDVRNTDFVTAFGQYNRLLDHRFYAGFRVDFNYDGIADLSYRVTLSPLAGYYFVKATNTTLSVEAGPSVVFEKYQDQNEDTYFGFRIGQRFEHKLSSTTKIWESVSYVPDVEKWSQKYTITAEAGIDAAINKHWSLRVVFQDIYDSQPANDLKNNDMRLIAGTAYKF
jgi:putative salt-induced outer membrane protein YdiY